MLVSLGNLANTDADAPLMGLMQAPAAAPADPLTTLNERLDKISNEYNGLLEKAGQRLDLLEGENIALKAKVSSLESQVAHLHELQAANVFSLSLQNLIWLGSAFGLLLIWLLALTFRRREKPKLHPIVAETEADVEDEYDYLGSEEGIAAKLDLARAYIDMGDTEQAREALHDVLQSGNPEQKLAAGELLQQIALDTVH